MPSCDPNPNDNKAFLFDLFVVCGTHPKFDAHCSDHLACRVSMGFYA
jgi:hypothetical protein